MGDTPRTRRTRQADDPTKLGGSVLREMTTKYRQIETVRQWQQVVPDVFNRSVSVLKAAQMVINADLHDGFSLGHVMKAIKAARDFEDSSPDAWLDHQLVGHVLRMREYRQVLNDYTPPVNDYREIARLFEVNRLLKQVAALIEAPID